GWMDAPFAVKAHAPGNAARGAVPLGVANAREWPVQRAEAVGAGGGDDSVECVVPAVTRVDLVILVRHTDGVDWHVHGRGVVARPEDQRLQPLTRGRNPVHVDDALRGLDLGLDADPVREAPVLL